MNILRNKTQKERILILVLAVLLIAAILFITISKTRQGGLAVYMNNNTVNVWDNEDSDDLNVSLVSYTSDKLKLGFYIPEDWTKKDIENGVVYTHDKSGSVFRLNISDYTPEINNISSSAISTNLVEQGYSFISFSRISANCYQVLYQDKQGVVNDYIETVYWDRSHIVTLSCSFSDKNYQGIIPYFDKIISSFKWVYENPIPTGYAIYYNSGIGFEMAVPADWIYSASDSALQFTDSKNGSVITLGLGQSTSSLSNLSATDMTNMMKNGKSNFMLKDFTTSDTVAYGLATYTLNNSQAVYEQYIVSNKEYLFYVSANYYSGKLSSDVAKTVASSIKVFEPEK